MNLMARNVPLDWSKGHFCPLPLPRLLALCALAFHDLILRHYCVTANCCFSVATDLLVHSKKGDGGHLRTEIYFVDKDDGLDSLWHTTSPSAMIWLPKDRQRFISEAAEQSNTCVPVFLFSTVSFRFSLAPSV